MLKKNTSIVLLLILVFSLFWIRLPTVKATSSIVDSNGAGGITDFANPQRRIGYGNSHWVYFFYGNNTAYPVVYRTSADALTWSNRALFFDTYFVTYSINVNGSTIRVTYTGEASSRPLLYRQGTINTDGTITWASEITVVAGSSSYSYSHCVVTVDSTGIPWIGYYNSSGNTYAVKASSANGATWGTPLLIHTANGGPALVALSSGKLYAVFYNSGTIPVPLIGSYFNGSSWGTASTIDTNPAGDFSAVALSNTVYLLYQVGSSDAVTFRTWNLTAGWSSSTSLSSNGYGTCSLGADSSKLYAYWEKYSTSDILYEKQYTLATSTWATTSTIEDDSAGAYYMDVVINALTYNSTHHAITYSITTDDVTFLMKIYTGGAPVTNPYFFFTSNPEIHAPFTVNGSSHTTPYNATTVKGHYNLTATSPLMPFNATMDYTFDHWLINSSITNSSRSILVNIQANTTFSIVYAPVHRAVVFDNVGSGSLIGTTDGAGPETLTLSWTHTVGSASADRFMIIGVSIRGPAYITNVTVGSQYATFLRADSGQTQRNEVWYLPSPQTGTKTVTVTLYDVGTYSGYPDQYYYSNVAGGSVSYYGVDPANPIDVSNVSIGNDSTFTASITLTHPNELVFMNLGWGGVATYSAPWLSGQTKRWQQFLISWTPQGWYMESEGDDKYEYASGTKTYQYSPASSAPYVFQLVALKPLGTFNNTSGQTTDILVLTIVSIPEVNVAVSVGSFVGITPFNLTLSVATYTVSIDPFIPTNGHIYAFIFWNVNESSYYQNSITLLISGNTTLTANLFLGVSPVKPEETTPSKSPSPCENYWLFYITLIILIILWALGEVYEKQWILLLPAVPALGWAIWVVYNGVPCNGHWIWMIPISILAIIYGLYRYFKR